MEKREERKRSSLMSHRFVSTREVCARIGKSRVTLGRWVKAGIFPSPKRVGVNGFSKVWLENELDDYFTDPEEWIEKHKDAI